MEISEIEQICKKPLNQFSHPHSDGEAYYGLGYWLKKYAFYPTSFPVYLFMDHGPSFGKVFLKSDLSNPFSKALVHNNLQINTTGSEKFKSIYVMGSPFVYYRRLQKIRRAANPEGSVFFPFHSTDLMDVTVDWDKICGMLLALPKKFQPITICLHYEDVNKGLHHEFVQRGFEITSAGYGFDHKFTERFYNIIADKKYAFSNAYMSCVPYCIEFGIPFQIVNWGKIILENKGGNCNAPVGKYELEYQAKGRIAETTRNEINETFSVPISLITDKQLELTNKVLGVNTALNRYQLSYILWREFLLYHAKKVFAIIFKMAKNGYRLILGRFR